jgi:hypothetical protein
LQFTVTAATYKIYHELKVHPKKYIAINFVKKIRTQPSRDMSLQQQLLALHCTMVTTHCLQQLAEDESKGFFHSVINLKDQLLY